MHTGIVDMEEIYKKQGIKIDDSYGKWIQQEIHRIEDARHKEMEEHLSNLFADLKSDYEKGNISLEEFTKQVRKRIESGDQEFLNLCCTHPDWTEICKSGVLEDGKS